MSEKKVSRNTGIVYATKVIDALLQLMIFDISLMLILIGFFGRTDIGAEGVWQPSVCLRYFCIL